MRGVIQHCMLLIILRQEYRFLKDSVGTLYNKLDPFVSVPRIMHENYDWRKKSNILFSQLFKSSACSITSLIYVPAYIYAKLQ